MAVKEKTEVESVTKEEVIVETKKVKKKGKVSWKPANLIEIPNEFKDSNYTYYCVDKTRAGRLMQKLREGWVVDKHIVPKMRKAGYLVDLPSSIQDEQPKDDTLQFRELIVLRMTKELAAEREEYYKSQDPLKSKLERQDSDFDNKAQGRGYGDIEIGKGG